MKVLTFPQKAVLNVLVRNTSAALSFTVNEGVSRWRKTSLQLREGLISVRTFANTRPSHTRDSTETQIMLTQMRKYNINIKM